MASSTPAGSGKRQKSLRWQRLERLNTPSPIIPLADDLDELTSAAPEAIEPPLAPPSLSELALEDVEIPEDADVDADAAMEAINGSEVAEVVEADLISSEGDSDSGAGDSTAEPTEIAEVAIESEVMEPTALPTLDDTDIEGEVIDFVPVASDPAIDPVDSATDVAPVVEPSAIATATTDELMLMTATDAPDATESEAIGQDDPDPEELLQPISLPEPDPLFKSGIFTVGNSGTVAIDVLWDGGQYQGQAGIFSLSGLETYELGSADFIAEVARRVTSNSVLGHLIWDDTTEAARFSGEMGGETNFNAGSYAGVKTFQMTAGDTFGMVLAPNTTFDQLLAEPGAGGSQRPFFSMAVANPHEGFQMGQIADVTGDGNTFTFEDLQLDRGDRDLNDFIFQVRGATGEAVLMDEVVAPGKDWRTTDAGQLLVSYTEQYVEAPIEGLISPASSPAPTNEMPLDFEASAGEVLPNSADGVLPGTESNLPGFLPTYTDTQFEFAPENQPVIAIIDTGFAGNNPDFKFNNITWGKDYVTGDFDPTLAAGEGSQHGTHILGVIAAQQDNGIGIDGINPDAPIYATRAIGSGALPSALMDAVDHIKASGQPNGVVNLSLDLTQQNPDGSITTRYELTPEERGAIEYARQNGVVLVVAAGNDGGVMSVLGQASQEFDNIVTVGAVERTNGDLSLYLGTDRVDYASYGDGLTVVADGGTPENPVLSTVDDGVGTMAGTSVATARVTGVVSQIWAANPELSYRQVIDILKQTATDLGTTGWDAQTGAGLVNLAAAISLARMTVGEGKIDPDDFWTPTTWSGAGRVNPLDRAVEFVSESFTLRLWPSDGVNLRHSPNFDDRSSISLPMNTWLDFDGWDYGTVNIDPVSQREDALYYRTNYNGQSYWVPSIWVDGYPPSNPPLLPTVQEEASTEGDQNSNDIVNELPDEDPEGSDWGTDEGDDNATPLVDPFASVYSAYQAILGGAVGGRFSPQAGVEVQNYANGQILRTPNGTYAVLGTTLKLYSELGGVNSWLGLPTGNTVNQGDGFLKQDFENGYIVWNGNRATAYRFGPGVSAVNAPVAVPTTAPKVIATQPMGGIRGRLVQGMNFRNYPWVNNSTLVGSMPAGTTFEVLEMVTTQPDPRYRHSDWYKVRLSNGAIGYFWAGEEFIALGNPGNPNSSSGSGTGSLLSIVGADYFLARPQFYTTGNPFFAYNAPVDVGGTGGLPANCTWYASGRVKEMGGSPAALASMLGNAENWHNQLSNGATIASSPQVGDIAQWSSNGQNHVAVVEKVNSDGSIVISESNYLSRLHYVRTISLGAVGTKATGWPDRFIRVPGAGTNTNSNSSSGSTTIALGNMPGTSLPGTGSSGAGSLDEELPNLETPTLSFSRAINIFPIPEPFLWNGVRVVPTQVELSVAIEVKSSDQPTKIDSRDGFSLAAERKADEVISRQVGAEFNPAKMTFEGSLGSQENLQFAIKSGDLENGAWAVFVLSNSPYREPFSYTSDGQEQEGEIKLIAKYELGARLEPMLQPEPVPVLVTEPQKVPATTADLPQWALDEGVTIENGTLVVPVVVGAAVLAALYYLASAITLPLTFAPIHLIYPDPSNSSGEPIA